MICVTIVHVLFARLQTETKRWCRGSTKDFGLSQLNLTQLNLIWASFWRSNNIMERCLHRPSWAGFVPHRPTWAWTRGEWYVAQESLSVCQRLPFWVPIEVLFCESISIKFLCLHRPSWTGFVPPRPTWAWTRGSVRRTDVELTSYGRWHSTFCVLV